MQEKNSYEKLYGNVEKNRGCFISQMSGNSKQEKINHLVSLNEKATLTAKTLKAKKLPLGGKNG